MKPLIFIRIVCYLLLFSFTGACQPPAPGYFPLTKGHRWSYQVIHTTMDGSRQQKYLLINGGIKYLNGERVHVRRSLSGTELYYRRDDTGIIYLGSTKTGNLPPVYRPERRLVLAFPLIEGTSWEETTTTKLLTKTPAMPQQPQFNIIAEVPVEGKIVSLNEAVQVPAGTFHACIKVELRGSKFKNIGNNLGLTLINVMETRWYAPGVGLVKLERVEKTQNEALDQGSLSLKLEQFRQG